MTMNGLKVDKADKLSGHILVKTGVSLMSWGGKIPMSLAEESSSGFYPHSGEQLIARCAGVSDRDEWCCNLKSGLEGQAPERSHRTRDEP